MVYKFEIGDRVTFEGNSALYVVYGYTLSNKAEEIEYYCKIENSTDDILFPVRASMLKLYTK